MTKEKAIEIAKALFAKYPAVQKFFIASDGQAFEHAGFADSHARSFPDKADQELHAVHRADCASMGSATDEVPTPTDPVEPSPVDPVANPAVDTVGKPVAEPVEAPDDDAGKGKKK